MCTALTIFCLILRCLGFDDVEPNTCSILKKLDECLLRRNEQRNWCIQSTTVWSGLRRCQHDHYCKIMGALSNYSSAAFAAAVLLRTCTHTHPDPTKRDSSPASFRFDELLKGSPKLEWLLRFLVDVFADHGHLTERLIIFADSDHSRRILYHFFEYVVGNRCDDNGRDARLGCLNEALFAASVPTIAGTSTPSDTAKALSQFASSNSESPVLIATSTSGGRGHNVPCTTRIVFWDVPPSSRAWLQCIYRGLRPPRPIDRTLYVYNLVMRDTVEEGYYTARWARAGLSDALMPQDDLGATRAALCAQREMLDK